MDQDMGTNPIQHVHEDYSPDTLSNFRSQTKAAFQHAESQSKVRLGASDKRRISPVKHDAWMDKNDTLRPNTSYSSSSPPYAAIQRHPRERIDDRSPRIIRQGLLGPEELNSNFKVPEGQSPLRRPQTQQIRSNGIQTNNVTIRRETQRRLDKNNGYNLSTLTQYSMSKASPNYPIISNHHVVTPQITPPATRTRAAQAGCSPDPSSKAVTPGSARYRTSQFQRASSPNLKLRSALPVNDFQATFWRS
ncbi:hypothetical protein K439DRAFT_472633 [Ramaria rubella]|nr:hypothetical protein K439DRAFT_472633 [Ramaria rubella]